MITPDMKDWTWVLSRPCPECGFEAGTCAPEEVAGLVRENAGTWARLLADGLVCSGRPNDSTWSRLEYACHVRDVYRRYDQRIGLMLTEEDPEFPNWDQDASAVEERYEEQVPGTVVTDLISAAETLASRLNRVEGAEWRRTGRRSDGASFTLEGISRYMIHDPIHHVWDVMSQGL